MKKKTVALSLLSMLILASCGGQSSPSHHLVFQAAKEATCTEDGMKEHYICSDASCEHKFFDSEGNELRGSTLIVEALGHDYREDSELRYLVREADCEHPATYHTACFRCGKEGSSTFESGEARGHRYGEATIEKAYAGQTYQYKGAEYTIEYVATVSCLDCGKQSTETKVGVFAVTEGKDSTCTVDGEATITVEFDQKYGGSYVDTVTLPKTGHNVEGVGYAYNGAHHWKECKECGERINQEAHALSSRYDDENHWKECSTCEARINVTPHTYGEPSISIVSLETRLIRSVIACSCGHTKTEEKTGTITVTKEATCTEKGEATISATFSTEFGGEFNGKIDVEAKGHTSDNVIHKDANGHYNLCSVCGAKMNEEAHVNTTWDVIEYPTDSDAGSRSSDCDVCGYHSVSEFHQCNSGDHVGTHLRGIEPTKTEAGVSGYYFCETCHKMILEADHVEGDGTWSESGVAEKVSKGHKAYLEPTITLPEVIASIDELEGVIAINKVPGSIEKGKYDLANSYLEAYLGKEGTDESDITNIETLRGAENTFGIVSISKVADSSEMTAERYNVYAPTGASIERDLKDDEHGVKFARISFDSEVVKYGTAFFVYGGVFDGLTGDVQIMVRAPFATSFFPYAMGSREGAQESYAKANEWTTIVIPHNLVQLVQQEMSAESPSYNTLRISNNTVFSAGQYIEIGEISSVSKTDLGKYKCVSNEGYNTLWTAGGLNGTLATDLHNSAWFNGAAVPEYHPDYRSYFLETKISNKTGADKTYEDLLVSNSYYGGLYFGMSTNYTLNENLKEAFFMVYSNEEVNIKYSNFGDIVRKWKEGSVTKETKIYKGWNAIHIDIDPSEPRSYNFNGHCFQIVPEVWSTTLELTMTAMFFLAA